MKLKRFAAIAAVLLMVIAVVGCGAQKRQVVQLTLSTEDSEAILRAAGIALPDAADAAGANSTVKWFSWYDPFQNYSEDQMINTGYYTFQEKYNGKVEWVEVEWGQRYDGVANLIMADTPPDLYPGEANTFPNFAIKGLYDAVNKFIDYDDPLWRDMKEYAYKYFFARRQCLYDDHRPHLRHRLPLQQESYRGIRLRRSRRALL